MDGHVGRAYLLCDKRCWAEMSSWCFNATANHGLFYMTAPRSHYQVNRIRIVGILGIRSESKMKRRRADFDGSGISLVFWASVFPTQGWNTTVLSGLGIAPMDPSQPHWKGTNCEFLDLVEFLATCQYSISYSMLFPALEQGWCVSTQAGAYSWEVQDSQHKDFVEFAILSRCSE